MSKNFSDLWFRLNKLHQRIEEIYYKLSKKEMKNLLDIYNIDDGKGLADLLFAYAELLDYYNGYGKNKSGYNNG